MVSRETVQQTTDPLICYRHHSFTRLFITDIIALRSPIVRQGRVYLGKLEYVQQREILCGFEMLSSSNVYTFEDHIYVSGMQPSVENDLLVQPGRRDAVEVLADQT